MPVRFPAMLGAWLLALTVLLGAAPGADAQGYQIRPGDTLNIEVLEDSSLNRNVLVLPDGTITFPLVGSVSTQGRTVVDLQNILASGLTSNFAVRPNVFVSVQSVGQPRVTGGGGRTPTPVTVDTYIVGEVAKPGRFDLEPGTTLLQLLAIGGGPTRFAAVKRIELRRTDPKTGHVVKYLFSYTGRANGPRISGGTMLAPGDVVVVPQRRLFE